MFRHNRHREPLTIPSAKPTMAHIAMLPAEHFPDFLRNNYTEGVCECPMSLASEAVRSPFPYC
jgi:hypothetical protein